VLLAVLAARLFPRTLNPDPCARLARRAQRKAELFY